MSRMFFPMIVAALGLSACGSTDLSRASTGAVAGGVIAAATDNDIATGALIGGVGGALCDDLTPGLCLD